LEKIIGSLRGKEPEKIAENWTEREFQRKGHGRLRQSKKKNEILDHRTFDRKQKVQKGF